MGNCIGVGIAADHSPVGLRHPATWLCNPKASISLIFFFFNFPLLALKGTYHYWTHLFFLQGSSPNARGVWLGGRQPDQGNSFPGRDSRPVGPDPHHSVHQGSLPPPAKGCQLVPKMATHLRTNGQPLEGAAAELRSSWEPSFFSGLSEGLECQFL